MLFDQFSLLTAIGFSGAALGLAFLTSWLAGRSEKFLAVWAIALGFIVSGVALYGTLGDGYRPMVHLASFLLMVAGFGFVWSGSILFRTGHSNWRLTLVCTTAIASAMVAPFAVDQGFVGTIVANLGMALLLGLSGREFWLGRAEAPLPMIANAVLYGAISASFVACAIALLPDAGTPMTARPSNLAEDFNMITVIIGLSSIGAVSLALNQSRIARRHLIASLTDPLTGLLNRRALFARHQHTVMQGGTAVVVFDLDHFKAINDRHGHFGGDTVLAHFADILRDCVDAGDVAARLGGEEFCVVLSNTTMRITSRIAEKIRSRLAEAELVSEAGPIRATVSVGIAMASDRDEAFDAVLDRADTALYVAKRNGRNQVHGGLHLVA